MKLYISIIIGLIYFTSSAQNTIQWMSIEEAQAQAIKDGDKAKKVFIDAYTDWCGWCKRMDKSTFLDSNVVQFINEYYYPVKFDAETQDTITFRGQQYANSKPSQGESKGKGSAHWLAVALLDGQLSYPSYIVLDEKMNRIGVYKGYMDGFKLMSVLSFYTSEMYMQYANFLYTEFNKAAQSQK